MSNTQEMLIAKAKFYQDKAIALSNVMTAYASVPGVTYAECTEREEEIKELLQKAEACLFQPVMSLEDVGKMMKARRMEEEARRKQRLEKHDYNPVFDMLI
jgi:hypothetical protein